MAMREQQTRRIRISELNLICMRLVVMPFMEQPTQYTLILSGLIVLSVTCNGLRRIPSEFLAGRYRIQANKSDLNLQR